MDDKLVAVHDQPWHARVGGHSLLGVVAADRGECTILNVYREVLEQRGLVGDVFHDLRGDCVELFRQLRNSANLKGKCGICEFRDICGGSRARAYAVSGDPLGEDPSCVYQPGLRSAVNI